MLLIVFCRYVFRLGANGNADYEWDVGHFSGAKRPPTEVFRVTDQLDDTNSSEVSTPGSCKGKGSEKATDPD